MVEPEYWNHNAHYQTLVLREVPKDCRRALDVGCGDGLLAARLATRVAQVTGVDRAPQMIELARARTAPNLDFAVVDFVDDPDGVLTAAGYDFVSAVTVVHHVDFATALDALVRLLAPGGRLVIVGLADDRSRWDLLVAAVAIPVNRWLARRHGGEGGPEGMPVKGCEMSWAEVRREARRLLPGCRYRRRLLWRSSLTWQKP